MPDLLPCPACGWHDHHPPQRFADVAGRVDTGRLLRCVWCLAVFEKPVEVKA